MPYRRFDWHEYISQVWREHRSVQAAADYFIHAVVATPDLLKHDVEVRKSLRRADANLEGTYIVRLFASFEAALRSYDRARHKDPSRTADASVMIDEIGGRKGRGIEAKIREGAHEVRRVRNYWAHDADGDPAPMSIDEARSRLQAFLSALPDEWE